MLGGGRKQGQWQRCVCGSVPEGKRSSVLYGKWLVRVTRWPKVVRRAAAPTQVGQTHRCLSQLMHDIQFVGVMAPSLSGLLRSSGFNALVESGVPGWGRPLRVPKSEAKRS